MKMKQLTEDTYWIAIAHLPRWTNERINRLVIQIIHHKKLTWSEFFELNKLGWKELFPFTEKEIKDLETAKQDLPRLAFIAEQLQNEGFHIIPINSSDYPVVLKENLKTQSSPPVLYTKGRKGLLQEDAVAIVGARKSGAKAIKFTDTVAKKCVQEYKVVVSGFAKGVDKQALDSTLEAHGKSIIVLPQGILTFQSGFKKYYEPIVNGDVLVLSAFFPKAPWEVGLAMARNTYIYGLAKEIYVAETDSKGGTWQGATNGLKRGRKIYVRNPEPNEKNANLQLIKLGATAVNMNGEEVENLNEDTQIVSRESGEVYQSQSIDNQIIDFLKHGEFTSAEIKLGLNLEWDSRKLTNYLRKRPEIKTIESKPLKFTFNEQKTITLFD